MDGAVILEIVEKRAQPLRPNEPARQRGLDDDVWNIMQWCWSFRPSQRPTAQIVLDRLAYLERSPIHSEAQTPFDEVAYEKLYKVLLESEREYVHALGRLQVYSVLYTL